MRFGQLTRNHWLICVLSLGALGASTGCFNASLSFNPVSNSALGGGAAGATQLIFSTSPPSIATAGASFTSQPAVSLLDANGNLITSATSAITLSAYTDSNCSIAAAPGLSATTNPLNA